VLLDRLQRRNPALIGAAIELHQRGAVPAGTYVLDLDAIADNAALLAGAAQRAGLRSYLMTKSYGRNPLATAVALAQGLTSTVAVEPQETDIFARFGIPLGHVGHLANVPRHAVRRVVGMRPDVVTVYTHEATALVSAAARERGAVQDVYVRVNRPADELFRGLVGGWTEEDAVRSVRRLLELPNVRVAGLTTFPCISYATRDAHSARLTPTFFTMLRARERLERELGLEGLRVNAPAFNNCATFPLLARHGATDVEPGTALLGASLAHAAQDLPERPAHVYVSEVMHRWGGELYTTGGGMMYLETYGGAADDPVQCMIGRTLDEAREKRSTLLDVGMVNYYAVCADHPQARVGDSAVFALHPQFFVNRAYVAVVSGVARGSPRVEGLFDAACHALDARMLPIAPQAVRRSAEALAERYARAVGSP
jgi:predicted amino acid racemase